MTSTPIIYAHQLCKRFNSTEIVHDLDLSIAPGGCFGLLGPNGAGKTTTIRMLMGRSPISSGELTVFGKPVQTAASLIRARMGVVPQTDNLDPDFTVMKNLEVYARYFGLNPVDLRGRIMELLDFVALTERRDDPVNILSGGMKRRLSIARALVNDPELLVLDEPTTGLDPQVRHLIWARLRELKQQGKTLLLTTHYMEEAERLCDYVAIMDNGKLINEGTPRALVKEHVDTDVIEIQASPDEIHILADGIPDCRIELVGETTYCYTKNAAEITHRLEGKPELTYLHRPANLEDVFLKLTGRELRD